MWPDSHAEWREAVQFSAVYAAVLKSLLYYPILAADPVRASALAYFACERAFDLADRRRDFPGYFACLTAYRLWLRQAAEREARRELFGFPAVRDCLEQLEPRHQQILLWYYVECFSPQVIGHLLYGAAPACEVMGREALRNAQAQLTQRIGAANPDWDEPNWTFPL
jgi:hypothetical protein